MVTASQHGRPRRPRGHGTSSTGASKEAAATGKSKATRKQQSTVAEGKSNTKVTTACQHHGPERPRGRSIVFKASSKGAARKGSSTTTGEQKSTASERRSKTWVATARKPHGPRRPHGRGTVSKASNREREANRQMGGNQVVWVPTAQQPP